MQLGVSGKHALAGDAAPKKRPRTQPSPAASHAQLEPAAQLEHTAAAPASADATAAVSTLPASRPKRKARLTNKDITHPQLEAEAQASLPTLHLQLAGLACLHSLPALHCTAVDHAAAVRTSRCCLAVNAASWVPAAQGHAVMACFCCSRPWWHATPSCAASWLASSQASSCASSGRTLQQSRLQQQPARRRAAWAAPGRCWLPCLPCSACPKPGSALPSARCLPPCLRPHLYT